MGDLSPEVRPATPPQLVWKESDMAAFVRSLPGGKNTQNRFRSTVESIFAGPLKSLQERFEPLGEILSLAMVDTFQQEAQTEGGILSPEVSAEILKFQTITLEKLLASGSINPQEVGPLSGNRLTAVGIDGKYSIAVVEDPQV